MLTLADDERAMLSGADGEAKRLAMELIVELAESTGADSLIDVSGAHIAGCFYDGQEGLEFAERLVAAGAEVSIPTTLSSGFLNLRDPGPRGLLPVAAAARRQMELYAAMGATPAFTCAPYHLPSRPRAGEDIAWGESNAVAFANSVLGARTNRWHDLTDICAAITGKAPFTGMHRPENRIAEVVFQLDGMPPELKSHDAFYHLLGYVVGVGAGPAVPVIDGLPEEVIEDQLRAIGAIGAIAGSLRLFHVVGVTPEAPTLEQALGGREPERVVRLSGRDLLEAREALTTRGSDELRAVCLGAPHMSLRELERLARLMTGRRVHRDVACYVSTSRFIADEARARGLLQPLEDAGVTLIVDTCTYFDGYVDGVDGVVMTDCAKWAYSAHSHMGVEISLATAEECAESAVHGRIVQDNAFWSPERWASPRA